MNMLIVSLVVLGAALIIGRGLHAIGSGLDSVACAIRRLADESFYSDMRKR